MHKTEVFFDNIEQRILKEIGDAHYAIFVSVAWFTNKKLFNALLDKARHNCYVSIIIQLDEINAQCGIDYSQIQIGRSECFKISTDAELLHDKFCVIDFKKVITGSYNWTYKASTNSENILILDDPSVATQYISRFEQQKAKFQNSSLQGTSQLSSIASSCSAKLLQTSNTANQSTTKKSQSAIVDYQICPFCKAHIAMGIQYCSNCKKDIRTQAIDKNGNGWVDLGLSVLWSTKTMSSLYLWNHSKVELSVNSDMHQYAMFFKEIENKDVASIKWGYKWRTPTKNEFEELIKKCKWEKILNPPFDEHAFKVTGPNGNSIIIPVTGHAGCLRKDFLGHSESENYYSECSLWTSTEDSKRPGRAYAFSFIGYRGFHKSMTAKEKKKQEFDSNRILSPHNDAEWGSKQWFENDDRRRKEEERILREMGNDLNERIENNKKDHKRRHALWLETPIEFFYDMDHDSKNTIKPKLKNTGYAIRPVADKKWQGKL